MTSAVDSLSIVPVEELPVLRDMFLIEWPKYVTAWNTIDSQYRNITTIKDFPVKVCVPFGNKDNGVVVIWQLIPGTYEISLYCLHEQCEKAKEAILLSNKIDWSSRVQFSCLKNELFDCANEILQLKNMKVTLDPTYITHISRDKAKQFIVEIPSDVKIEKAKLEQAASLNDVWPHKYPGSEDYFRRMINWGFVMVLLGKEEEEIRGWVLTSVRGEQHTLHILDNQKRKGYGQLLIKWLGKKLANEEREVFGCVVPNNVASEEMFKKINFNALHLTLWIVGSKV